MQTRSKPEDMDFLKEDAIKMCTEAMDVKQKDMKAPPNHMQTLIDGMGLFTWCFFGSANEIKDHLDEVIGQIPFYGNKVLTMDKELDTAWYNAYFDLA